MRIFGYLILLFLFSDSVLAELSINEVMYDPPGSDNNNEYIEVYTDLNISNFTIEDLTSADILKLIEYKNSNYSLIVEEGFNTTHINATVYSVGATIGNNLNNDNDIIVLKDNTGKILDVFSYTNKFGADNNGLSLCRNPDKTGQFKECSPSPGASNENNEFFNLKITEVMPNPVGNDTAQMPQGEWGSVNKSVS